MKNDILRAVRGMKDGLPKNNCTRQMIASKIIHQTHLFDYAEIKLPIVEYAEVFTRGIGMDTDVINKEMYSFQDRNGEWLSLRPEGTAGCVRAVIENTGYLPTFCSAQSLATKAVRGVQVSLELNDGAKLVQGRATQSGGELSGRAFRASSALLAFLSDQSDDRCCVEWVVDAAEGQELTVCAAHDRAGKTVRSLRLGLAEAH